MSETSLKLLLSSPFFSALVILLFVCTLFSCKIETEKKTNILFIIADDMSRGQTSFEGNQGLNTPNLDFLAENGVFFENAYCSAPSCSPSRAAILTGRNGYELEEGAGLYGTLPAKFPVYTDLLGKQGYKVGYTGKGWGPGSIEEGGRDRNPAGEAYNQEQLKPFPELGSNGGIFNIDYSANFKSFLEQRTEKQPFCFWFGPLEPHRIFDEGIGLRSGKKLEDAEVPGYLPDNKVVRSEFLDFYFEIDWIDYQVGQMLNMLREKNELENTLIVFTSDNGMPFPRAKSTLYDDGIHMPLYAYWAKEMEQGRSVGDFINLADLAPTFLEAAGVTPPQEMTSKSFLGLLKSDKEGRIDEERDFVVAYKERHSIVQKNPEDIFASRAIRQGDYLLIWNIFPDLWPLGHIVPEYNPFLFPFGDAGDGVTKTEVMKTWGTGDSTYLKMIFMPKGSEYELYNVKNDPDNLHNLAQDSAHIAVVEELRDKMFNYLRETGDPRLVGGEEVFWQSNYHGFQGLNTGFWPPTKWNALDEEGKKNRMEVANKVLEENRKKLRDMGWDTSQLTPF